MIYSAEKLTDRNRKALKPVGDAKSINAGLF